MRGRAGEQLSFPYRNLSSTPAYWGVDERSATAHDKTADPLTLQMQGRMADAVKVQGRMAEEFKVNLLLFAAVREKVGQGKLELKLSGGATTVDLLGALLGLHPSLADILPSCALSVNRKYLSTEKVALLAGDEVAIIPPVSGG
ncbi:hypothetical protein T492DRAFT_832698 [Pavlovales sp. CCMP2436]|nr:hypothetical protein T492DRAFT_832698 [Pavlovales sp. CCMP2436]